MARDLDDDLDALLSQWCDGTLDAEGSARLDSLLTRDERARRCYTNYMFLHAELYSQHATLRMVDGPGSEECSVSKLSASSRNRRSSSSSLWWVAVAAAFVGVAAVSSWLTYVLSGRSLPVSVAVSPRVDGTWQGAPTVAKITATRNCLWQATSEGVGFGTRLHAGQRLELAAGLVEITFDDGAAVVLEGPATFEVRDRGRSALHAGRLAASVPPRAQGFEVATARVNVIDVGTEFGVMAEPEGTTEIHVFNGFVKAQLLNERGQAVRLVELNTSEAARIQPALSLVARIPARDEEFVRTLSIAPGPHDGLYAYEGFNYPIGPLAEQNGGFGWAGPWFNVELDVEAGSNSNGIQAGSLEYQGVVPMGNRAVQTAHQNRIRRALSTSVGGVFDAAGLVENQDGMRLVGRDGTVVYLSFLQRVSKTSDVFYGFELHRSDGNANRVLCIGHGAEGTGYGVTSNYNVYGQRNFPALGEENTTTNFFVVRMTFGPGNRDRVEVLRNPQSLVDESLCKVDTELVGNFAFDRISLGNFHGSKIHEVDEIRVGTTFRAVTGRRGRGPDRLMPHVASWEEAEAAIGMRRVELLSALAAAHRRGTEESRQTGRFF